MLETVGWNQQVAEHAAWTKSFSEAKRNIEVKHSTFFATNIEEFFFRKIYQLAKESSVVDETANYTVGKNQAAQGRSPACHGIIKVIEVLVVKELKGI